MIKKRFLFVLAGGCLLGLAQCSPKPAAADPAPLRHVGDIRPDPRLDDPDFAPCNELRIVQYYSVDTYFRGGAKAIRKLILPRLHPVPKAKGQNGWVTVRFVINCRGETGRFRMLEIDRNYQPCTFHRALTDQLLAATKELHNWQPGQYDGATYDSYYYLNFKIADGAVQDILP